MNCVQRRAMAKNPSRSPEEQQKIDDMGRRIALARERADLTQAALAHLIGVTAGAVAQYETGRNMPRYERLEKIGDATGASIEWLMTGNDPDEIARAHTAAELKILQAIRRVPSDRQALAVDLIVTMGNTKDKS